MTQKYVRANSAMGGVARYIACLLCVLLCITTTAQQQGNVSLNFRHLDISNGLASNHVSAIMQDRHGFIWIASTALQRYDGTNFITVASFERVPGSIYYDNICLCEDKRGRIWMGSPENIRVYDPVTSRLRSLKTDRNRYLADGVQCSNIIEDHKGVIWATTRSGLMYYDEKDSTFKRADIIPETDRIQMKDAIMEDEEGSLWISGAAHLYILDSSRRELYTPKYNPQQLPVFDIDNSFKRIYTDPQHRIWLAGREGKLYCYDPRKRTAPEVYHFTAMQARQGKIHNEEWDAVFDVIADHDKNLWVATEKGGVFRFNDSLHSFDINITGDNVDVRGFHYDYEANCFLSDREGHLWIGTDRGVNILSLHSRNFQLLDRRADFPGTPQRLPDGEVTGIFQAANGDVYVGYWGKGFSRLSPKLELYHNYVHTPGNTITGIPEERGLVWSFAELRDGTILVGQENGYLSLLNPSTGKFIKHLSSPFFYQQTLLHVLPQHDTTVWIGLYKRGLARWNPKNDSITYYSQLLDSVKRPVSVMQVVPENDSLLWLATASAGLISFNVKTSKIASIHTLKWGVHNYVNVTTLLQYSDSLLLAGTEHGLWMFNTGSRTYRPLMVNNQLFDEWVLHIRKDKTGKVWFTSQTGFYRLSLPGETLETFIEGDDIINNNRKVRRRIVQLKDGRMLVGGSDYFVTFDPSSLRVAPPPPDVTIVSMKAMDSTILIGDALRNNSPVELTYRQNFISIEFRSLQYHQQKLRYYYQLSGVDENWVSADNILVAKYTGLEPGLYTFRVRAVNAAGTFSEHISSLRIFIRPAFWQTPWFKILVLLIVAAFVYLYIKLRIAGVKREAKKRAAIQQQMAQLEMKALRAQMNPHFIFNALNSIQTFMMKSETEQALSYLSRFARLIRNVLDNSQLNHIPISKEVNMLTNYMELEKLRFTDQFEYFIHIDPELDADLVEIPTMIMQPFIENAIWHGLLHLKTKGRLIISFRKENDRVLCTIEDNGMGREYSLALKNANRPEYDSKGLQITRDRLQLYNNRYKVDAGFNIEDLINEVGEPVGTRINLWFPLVEE
ncbi:MAG TPA: two-component regulator propeller domain-containing protein [Chitinophaga sp.]|uniref:ligand-binding sensor domain-containing protein n=1 Tax=Chitinophaga sp. TaxID=1869181 RepID=UPI002CC9D90D|nr:two-component regulator propeller domain-containing protein [Chitinophaga sp.]HVI47021.1 two-component regulator propeller domain-containing protein [Chitinophaga sp.]